MAGVDLQLTFRELATQIKRKVSSGGREINAYPFPVLDPHYPCVTVYPVEVNHFSTFGSGGICELSVRLKVEVDADKESMGILLCDFLSIGTGNASSIFDAIHADQNLNGTAETCVALTAEWGDHDTEPGVAWIPVEIKIKKVGALP